MKKILFLILATFVIHFYGAGQTQEEAFYFSYNDVVDYEEASSGFVPKHYLGEELAVKMNKLRLTYTYKPERSSMNPNPTMVVEKPYIYNAIKKLNAYYKKQLKKGEITEEEVMDKLSNFIEIGVVIRYQDTFELEEALKNVKEDKEIEDLFAKVQFK